MPTLRASSLTTTDVTQVVLAPVGTMGAVVTVANAGVIMNVGGGSWTDPVSGRTETPDPGAVRWADDEPLLPIIYYIEDEPLKGLRFRSRATGTPANVDVTFLS